MAKLIYSLDGAFLGEFPLEKECTTIGRRLSNDIHIDNLAISGEHAAIVIAGHDAILQDLNSTNGTIVNGKAIKKHRLQHGDVIELGKYQLKYIDEAVLHGKRASGPAGQEKLVDTPPAAVNAQEPPRPEVAAPSHEALLAHIQVLNGSSAGKELVLSKALTTLGKPGVQVAVIARRPNGYFVTHVEGGRHPVVNGNSIGAQAHQLVDHDVIEIAGVKMEFFFVDA